MNESLYCPECGEVLAVAYGKDFRPSPATYDLAYCERDEICILLEPPKRLDLTSFRQLHMTREELQKRT